MSFKPSNQDVRVVHANLRHYDIMYRRGTPEISDAEYDAMFRMLQSWEHQYPEIVTPNSPTQIVEHEDDGSEEPWYA